MRLFVLCGLVLSTLVIWPDAADGVFSVSTVERVSVDEDGNELLRGGFELAAGLSGDGDVVAFNARRIGRGGIRTRSAQTTEFTAEDQVTGFVDLSRNGRYAVTSSRDLIDRHAGTSVRLDISRVEHTDLEVSDDANVVAYQRRFDLGGGVFIHDRAARTTLERRGGFNGYVSLSADGGDLLYTDRLNIIHFNLTTGVERAIFRGGPEQLVAPNAAISSDGNFAVLNLREHSAGSRSEQIQLVDLRSNKTEVVYTGEITISSREAEATVSADGRYVAYLGYFRATPEDPLVRQAFVYDTRASASHMVSINELGEPADRDIVRLEISDDGSTVSLTSAATNLVPGDTNDTVDVFVVDLVIDGPGVEMCAGRVVTIVGSGEIVGTSGDDVIMGSDGPDRIEAGEGDDVVCGMRGDDIIRGGSGADLLVGGEGRDRLRGGDGPDRILGGPGSDRVFGEADADSLAGGPGHDRVVGGPGDDSLAGGPGIDTCRGSGGTDRYFLCETKQP